MNPSKPRLSQICADKLLYMIVDKGQYPSGCRLPSENELSQILQVSRTTVREAISNLASQGVLEVRRGLGTFVCQDIPADRAGLDVIQKPSTKKRARDLFEMRLIFEPVTAALACERASDAEIAEIARLAENMKACADEGGDWPKLDQAFHMAIIKASHNEYMQRLYPIINDAVDEIMQRSDNRDTKKQIALNDNLTIVDFLLKRDADGAREAMGVHMRHLIHTM